MQYDHSSPKKTNNRNKLMIIKLEKLKRDYNHFPILMVNVMENQLSKIPGLTFFEIRTAKQYSFVSPTLQP